jgi:RHH-type proline utilization regulon transcriptional repressor/proline dehydrogenase/delta 1-pyrroline-5-carboxylate dehydrogenase
VALRPSCALLHEAGVPADALQLLHGTGETVGAALVAHPHTAGVCFTGSTQVAKLIQRTLAAKDGPIVPLIAETGGLNAMVVDSTALPEQVVDAVVQSAFRSAGQRCSALRLLCVHESIADSVIEMLRARWPSCAWATRPTGHRCRPADRRRGLCMPIQRAGAAPAREARLLGETPLRWHPAHLLAPVAFEIGASPTCSRRSSARCCTWCAGAATWAAVVRQINALGYGLTLGVQTRIDSRAQRIADTARMWATSTSTAT